MEIDDILNSPFTFTVRKNFTPCDTRPLWKSCLVILILGITGKNNSSSLKKIHVANWIVKKEDHLTSFINWAGKDERKRPNVRLEPSIDRVINLLFSNGVILKSDKKIVLTDLGIDIFNKIEYEDIYNQEKSFLTTAKKYLSEASVERLFKGV